MKLSDLSTETLEKIKLVRWDRIIEKHEGRVLILCVFRGFREKLFVSFLIYGKASGTAILR
ncbi:hypothetical protein [Nostoc sp. UHCC 0870]|uniref:hypothetical protein n=1 Tax=Nostoc sp. UHCC 0870 TaxID=2914041 RepID=UPI001EDD3332|nr:hypothetical protein [Nostoc sp. UHCC 0870]UKP01136.1 hypothetical protein L6494_28150 [Nostoc sp. UHCC 0870]